MKNMKLTAAVVFLTGFLAAGLTAAAEAEEEHHHAAAGAGEGHHHAATAAKGKAAKSDSAQEKATKAALQKYNCLLCHKYKGKGGEVGPALDEHLRHHPKEQLKKLLKEPKKPMPPFPGTDQELEKFLKTVIPAAAGSGAEGKPAAKRTSKAYVCPMGEFESDKPGKCPKCGMTLVEKK